MTCRTLLPTKIALVQDFRGCCLTTCTRIDKSKLINQKTFTSHNPAAHGEHGSAEHDNSQRGSSEYELD